LVWFPNIQRNEWNGIDWPRIQHPDIKYLLNNFTINNYLWKLAVEDDADKAPYVTSKCWVFFTVDTEKSGLLYQAHAKKCNFKKAFNVEIQQIFELLSGGKVN
jgi:hypothetical protein